MTTEDGAVKQNKHRTKHEKKKRKHIEVEPDTPVAKKKKSKLASDSISKSSSNGAVLVHRTGSPTTGNHQDTNLTNGPHTQAISDYGEATTTPRRKKDKSKHSQTNGHTDDMPVSTTQEPGSLSPVSTKKSKVSEDQPAGILSPPPSSKKAKPYHEVKNSIAAADEPSLMEIDTEEPQPTTYISETPFIQRSVQDILSVAPLSSKKDTRKSPFFQQTIQIYIPLSPITLSSALEGACAEHLSPLLLKFYPPLHGVVLSYAQPHFLQTQGGSSRNPTSQALAVSVAEYTTPMAWLEVDMLLFKPVRGHAVEGVIVLQSESHVGLQVYNLFSGRIVREHLPPDWTWNQAAKPDRARSRKGKLKGGRDEQQDTQQVDVQTEVVHDDVGYWTDGTGKKVEGVLKLWVWSVEIALGVREAERNLPTIEGTLLEESLREDAVNELADRRAVKKGKRRA